MFPVVMRALYVSSLSCVFSSDKVKRETRSRESPDVTLSVTEIKARPLAGRVTSEAFPNFKNNLDGMWCKVFRSADSECRPRNQRTWHNRLLGARQGWLETPSGPWLLRNGHTFFKEKRDVGNRGEWRNRIKAVLFPNPSDAYFDRQSFREKRQIVD